MKTTRSLTGLAVLTAVCLLAGCARSETPQDAQSSQQPAAATAASPAPATSPTPAAPAGAETTPAPAAPAQPASTAVPQATPPAEPPPPPKPTFEDVTVPAGTEISLKLISPLASNKNKVEDPVSATVAKSILVSGTTAVPAGSEIKGSVTEATESGRVKGRAAIAFALDRIVVRGETVRIQTVAVRQEAEGSQKEDVKKGGLGAGAGAIIGGVAGGGKGAAIGAVVGATGTVLATKGKEVSLPTGSIVTATLSESFTVRVPVQ